MKWRLALNGGIAGAALLVAACGGTGTSAYGTSSSPSSNGPGTGVASSPTGAPAPAAMATVALRSTAFGQILVDGSGRTLYLFQADKPNMSTCYGDCAAVWPPLTVTAMPSGGAGINESLLATSKRTDGSLGVTYNGHPLYYFVSDKQPGDTTGQAINSFGAEWYVLSAAGSKVDKG